MKTNFIALFILISAIGCSQKEGVTISGQISDLEEGNTAYIDLIVNQEKVTVDSFVVQANGKFEKLLKVDEAGFYRVSFDRHSYVNLILNKEDVKISKNGSDDGPKYIIEGSKDTDFIERLAQVQRDFEDEVQELNLQFGQARSQGDMKTMQGLQVKYVQMSNAHQKKIKEEIWAMDNSIAGIFSINFLENLEANATFLDSLATKYEEQLPESSYTAELRATAEQFKKLSIGAVAPEINLPTPEGTNLSLSSFKGKYVLVDFWAAWCGPCRRENPNVVRMYNEYHDKGFEILSVSLDRSKDKWLQAIQQDGLTWNHVSDLKYFNSQAAQDYQISAIPATYLIGPEGKIVAKNLRGSSLEAKLKEIFG